MKLKIAGPTASARVSDAVELVSRPRLLDALSEGDITPTKVWILNEQSCNLSRDEADTVIDRVLSLAASKTPSQFRRAVRKTVMSIDPDAVKRRAQAATKDGGVWLRELAGGMAELSVIGPAGEVTGAYAVLDELAPPSPPRHPRPPARRILGEDRDGRTQPNRRFDTMVDLVCGPLGHPAPRRDHHETPDLPTPRLHHARRRLRRGPSRTLAPHRRHHLRRPRPYCRRDHRMTPTPGWHIDHHPDGTATWTTPSGSTYQYTPEPIAQPVTQPPPSRYDGEPPF